MLERNKFKFPNELSKSKRFLHTKIFSPSHDLPFDTDERFGVAEEKLSRGRRRENLRITSTQQILKHCRAFNFSANIFSQSCQPTFTGGLVAQCEVHWLSWRLVMNFLGEKFLSVRAIFLVSSPLLFSDNNAPWIPTRTHILTPQRTTRYFSRYFQGLLNLLVCFFQISWMRKRDLHILTSNNFLYTGDQRFSVIHPQDSDEWNLKIEYAQPKDAGTYECQVSDASASAVGLVFSRPDPQPSHISIRKIY